MKHTWHHLTPDPGRLTDLRRALNCHPAVAAILVNRGIDTPDRAQQFLNAPLSALTPPFSLKGMNAAVHRIHRALDDRETILVFGDYDADGITATAIVYEFIKSAGGDVSWYIPHRMTEGYGFKPFHVHDVAAARGVDLIVTVDCGSSSHDAAEAAASAGIDLIITDHHQIAPPFPRAVAVVNPHREDNTAAGADMAGVGIAFCLLICLRKHLRDVRFWTDTAEPNLKTYCDMVALGTQGDMVPMVGDNRILVKTGIDVMRAGHRPGLKALFDQANMDAAHLDAEDMAYQIVPRINAAGRMDSARPALSLMLTQDPEEAARLAAVLDDHNRSRRQGEKKVVDDVMSHLRKHPHLLERRSIVLWGRHWHEGVLGIVASRIVKRFYRPVILLTADGAVAKGSGRSIPEVNIYDGLSQCSELLTAFGGHAMAAGLTLGRDRLERFSSHFEAVVAAAADQEVFVPGLSIDHTLRFDDITDALVDAVENLAPFGTGNPKPVFASRGVHVRTARVVGDGHLQMMLTQRQDMRGPVFRGIWFGADPQRHAQTYFHTLAYHLQWNRWNGNRYAQLVIVDAE